MLKIEVALNTGNGRRRFACIEKTNSNIVVRIAIRTFLNDNELKEFL